VYGVDSSGNPGIAGLSPVNQKTIVSAAGNKFLVRLLTGKPPGVTAVATTGQAATNDSMYEQSWDVTTDMRGSEWDDLMVGVIAQKPSSFKGESLGALDFAGMILQNAPSQSQTMCQNVTSAGGVTSRGVFCDTTNQYVGTMAGHFDESLGHTAASSVKTIGGNTSNTTYYSVWRPVLEWIG
jgi:hypothetical protein